MCATIVLLLATTPLVAQDTNGVAALKAIQVSCAKIKNAPSNVAFINELGSYSKVVSNREVRAKVTASYALGMLATRQNDAASKSIQYLRTTFPDSPCLALFETSRYQIDCPKCGGNGKIEAPCTRCNGKGRCPGCNGRGSIERIGNRGEQCSFCGGSGRCKACGGSGHETAKCTQCYGSRRIVSGDLIARTFLMTVDETRDLAFVEEQRANGLIEYDGRWMTPKDKEQEIEKQTAIAKAQQAEAERRLAQESRKKTEAEKVQAEQGGQETAHRNAQRGTSPATAAAAAGAPMSEVKQEGETAGPNVDSNAQQQNNSGQTNTQVNPTDVFPIVLVVVSLVTAFFILFVVQTRAVSRNR